jgi:hypothetical protein
MSHKIHPCSKLSCALEYAKHICHMSLILNEPR